MFCTHSTKSIPLRDFPDGAEAAIQGQRSIDRYDHTFSTQLLFTEGRFGICLPALRGNKPTTDGASIAATGRSTFARRFLYSRLWMRLSVCLCDIAA